MSKISTHVITVRSLEGRTTIFAVTLYALTLSAKIKHMYILNQLKNKIMNLDINKIASDKITSMVASGELEKRIIEGIEKNVNSAIDSATNDYSWKCELEKNISKVIGEVASKVNFEAYSNFLTDRINKQVEERIKGEMLDSMKESFEKTYFNIPDDVKLSTILEMYKKYLERTLDSEDKQDWGDISFSFEEESGCFIRIKAGHPKKNKFERFDNGIEFSLYKNSRKDNKATLTWIRSDGNNFQTSMTLSHLTDFEILMFNLMFTRKEIEIDIDEDFCFDVDFEDPEDDE